MSTSDQLSLPASPIPVTILTGFLGAGKTTLLNHLLQHNPGEKIAIIENEFGEINLDSQLLQGSTGIEIIELTNGCVCCSVRGELTAALHDLLARRDVGTLLFDRLILETTGLADPAPVVQTFFTDATLRERLALDAVITLVDSVHAQRQLTEHRVAVSQVGFADRLVLTKIDSIDEEEKKLLIDRLRQINVRAPLIEADHGKLPRAAWLDLHAFDLDPSLPIDKTLLSRQTPSTPTFTATPSPTLFKHSWNDNIVSHVLTAGSLDLTRIGGWMEQLIADHGNDMLRYKGIFAITDEPRRLIVQGVHKVVGFDYGPEWREGEERISLLVVIGRDLPIEHMQKKFSGCAL